MNPTSAVITALLVALPTVGEPETTTGDPCIPGTIERDLGRFTKLEVGGGVVVNVKQGTSYSASVTLPKGLVRYLHIEQPGRTLRIHLDPCTPADHAPITAEVTMPEITDIIASGASKVALSGFCSDEDLDVTLSGASALRGEITCGDLDLNLSAESTVQLSGRADDVSINATGSSAASLSGLVCDDLAANLSGTARVTVAPTGAIAGALGGDSELLYKGNPMIGAVMRSGTARIGRVGEQQNSGL